MPGTSIGRIAFNGGLTFGGILLAEISKTGAVLTNDVLACSGIFTPGGVLTVYNIGADAVAVGDSFKLIDAGGFAAGCFAALNLPGLPSNLAWDASRLCVDGTIRVEPMAPPPIAFEIAAGILTLYWPTEYSSYVLEGQTNQPGQGLGLNWLPVSGVISNSISIPIDPGNGSAFYRLARP
jgi:hypothetical protein